MACLVIVAVSAALLIGGVALPRLTGSELWGQDTAELAALGLWQAATVLLTLLASAMLGGRPREVLALGPPVGAAHPYLKALGLLAALQIVVSAVQYSFFQHDMYTDLRPFVRLFAEQWLLALLVVGIGAPVSEELLFRGFLQSALARTRIGFWWAALITTVLWTTLHAGYSAVGLFEVFLIGLFFSWLLWRTGSLWVPIFCHAAYNSLIVLVLRFVDLPAPG
jgi:membrane protease YdiL (CAAX protease family)